MDLLPSRTIRFPWLIGALLLGAGCTPRPPMVPPPAHDQDPASLAPAPWQGQGRFILACPGHRLSATALVRAYQDHSVRLVVLSDAGVVLADVSVDARGRSTVHASIPDLRSHVDILEAMVAEPYGPVAGERRIWRDGVLEATIGRVHRWYGGDPVLLRTTTGTVWPLEIADYRPCAGGLVPRAITAIGPLGCRLDLRLQTLTAGAAHPVPSPH